MNEIPDGWEKKGDQTTAWGISKEGTLTYSESVYVIHAEGDMYEVASWSDKGYLGALDFEDLDKAKQFAIEHVKRGQPIEDFKTKSGDEQCCPACGQNGDYDRRENGPVYCSNNECRVWFYGNEVKPQK